MARHWSTGLSCSRAMFSTIERMAPSSFGAVDDQHVDLLETGGDRLLHAAMTGIDDVAIAAIGLGSDDGRLDDADGLDRRQQQRVGLRAGLGPARLVGIVLQRARIDLHEFHGMFSFGVSDAALRRSFLVFFPKTSPGPRSGRAGAIAPEHPCPAGQAGLTALRRTTGRDREGPIERQRRRVARSRAGFFFSPLLSLPLNLQSPIE